mgnify:FL=1|tara:strand:- start:1830 stop:2282 length:453 start_codon:yes stop_codon:yes gene_type:complete
MAITFDPATKIIQLDTFTVSERQLWTAFVNWSVLSDNLKYGVGMTQIGGEVPIALYIYLTGWRVRPIESDGITTIEGNLLTTNGGSPIASTLGNWQVQVNLETPVKAVLTEGGGGGGSDFTAIEKAALLGNTSMIPFVAFTPSNSDILGN